MIHFVGATSDPLSMLDFPEDWAGDWVVSTNDTFLVPFAKTKCTCDSKAYPKERQKVRFLVLNGNTYAVSCGRQKALYVLSGIEFGMAKAEEDFCSECYLSWVD